MQVFFRVSQICQVIISQSRQTNIKLAILIHADTPYDRITQFYILAET